MDEKYEQLNSSKVPFIESYNETVYEEQMLGEPLEREILVVRIDKSYLKLYSFFLVFFVVLTIFYAFFVY